jgi:imidazolonepropionase-like amidohydrolase
MTEESVAVVGGRVVPEGLAWATAVRALTINPARIAGIDEGIGSLEPVRTPTW